MAAEIDIANLALAHLGDDANVTSFDPPEGSPQAENCARFYPIARDTLLEMHPWSFATATAALTLLGDAPEGWLYAYALPNGCIKPLSIYGAGLRRDERAQSFELEAAIDGQPVLYSDHSDASIRFTQRITDTTRYPALFTEALSWLLASMLAGPVIKGDSGASAGTKCYQVFLIRFADAARQDANKSRSPIEHTPPWIARRGGAPLDRYLGQGLWRYNG